MKKSVFFIAVIVLLLGALGFGGYKYMELQKDNKNMKEKLVEANKASATNDYNLFVKHMKEVREQYEQVHSYGGDKLYGVTLTKNGELSINNSSRKVVKIADNVLLFKAMIIPELAINGLCYVTEDGFVYVADIERAFEDGSNVKITKQKYAKEIVNIISIPKPDKIDPAFIDINGNLYTYSY